jgi:hypothetical protein
MRTIPLPALLLVLLATASCASNPSPNEAAGATVVVDNRASLIMDIYVRRREQPPIRLGFAPADQQTRFAISPALVAGAGLFRFEARPSPAGQPTFSDPLSVRPGDELTWVVPAQ